MRMDAEWVCDLGFHLADNTLDIPGHRSAVGVAQHDHFRAAADRGFQGLERVGSIRFVAVEEMLGVVDDALAIGFEISHRLFDDAQVIVECG